MREEAALVGRYAQQHAAAQVASGDSLGHMNRLLADEPDVAARQVEARIVAHDGDLVARCCHLTEVVLAPSPPQQGARQPERSGGGEQLALRQRGTGLVHQVQEVRVGIVADFVVPLHTVETARRHQPDRLADHRLPNTRIA